MNMRKKKIRLCLMFIYIWCGLLVTSTSEKLTFQAEGKMGCPAIGKNGNIYSLTMDGSLTVSKPIFNGLKKDKEF